MAFCGVIERELTVEKCPLRAGACVWQHKLTGDCVYTETASIITLTELSALVGVNKPTDQEVSEIKTEIKQRILNKG
jgi:hypothetical protein